MLISLKWHCLFLQGSFVWLTFIPCWQSPLKKLNVMYKGNIDIRRLSHGRLNINDDRLVIFMWRNMDIYMYTHILQRWIVCVSYKLQFSAKVNSLHGRDKITFHITVIVFNITKKRNIIRCSLNKYNCHNLCLLGYSPDKLKFRFIFSVILLPDT